jgi:hypothetical protein
MRRISKHPESRYGHLFADERRRFLRPRRSVHLFSANNIRRAAGRLTSRLPGLTVRKSKSGVQLGAIGRTQSAIL